MKKFFSILIISLLICETGFAKILLLHCSDVKLVGFADYPNLGPTHSETNAETIMSLFDNIKSFFPKNSDETEKADQDCYNINGPTFISLKTDKELGKKW